MTLRGKQRTNGMLTGEVCSNKPETSNDEYGPLGLVKKKGVFCNLPSRSNRQSETGRDGRILCSRKLRKRERQEHDADKFKTQHTL